MHPSFRLLSSRGEANASSEYHVLIIEYDARIDTTYYTTRIRTIYAPWGRYAPLSLSAARALAASRLALSASRASSLRLASLSFAACFFGLNGANPSGSLNGGVLFRRSIRGGISNGTSSTSPNAWSGPGKIRSFRIASRLRLSLIHI